MSELLVALVGVPIVGAVLPPLASQFRERTGWPVAVATLSVQLTLALMVTGHLLDRGRLSHAVGGIRPPFGVEFVLDGLAAPFVLLVTAVALGALAYTRVGGPRSAPFYSLYLLLVAGLTGVCVTGDAFTLYVFLEISGLAAYAMVARASGGAATLAALQYLFLGTVGATFYLLGVGYAYAATGTLNMADLATRLAAAGHGSRLVVAAFVCIALGLAIKVALVPLHTWLPGAHSEAPVAVSVLLSGLVTSVAAYALVRLALTVFTPAFFRHTALANEALLVAAAASVLYGGYRAVRETKVKRVLAYSTVAQFGVALLGLGLLGATALTGTVIHLVGHGVMKGGLFLTAGCFAARYGATTVDDYAGLARREPLLGVAFAIGGLGMVGLPPTVGLPGKWYIALGAVESGAWLVAALVLASTLLSLSVFGPILARLYLEPAPGITPTGTVSLGMKTIAAAAAVASLALGFSAPFIGRILSDALPGVL